MFYVRLIEPLPGIRSTVFFFFNQLEAEEFASSLHATFSEVKTEEGTAGEATEVFEGWSF